MVTCGDSFNVWKSEMRSEEHNGEMNYWVTTESGFTMGPYEDYTMAIQAAWINFGFEGWTISSTSLEQEGNGVY